MLHIYNPNYKFILNTFIFSFILLKPLYISPYGLLQWVKVDKSPLNWNISSSVNILPSSSQCCNKNSYKLIYSFFGFKILIIQSCIYFYNFKNNYTSVDSNSSLLFTFDKSFSKIFNKNLFFLYIY